MSNYHFNRKVCVIGGGPAGLSCALWLKNLGLSPLILERSGRLGGLQNTNENPNNWYIGIPGKIGKELIKEFVAHVERENLDVLLNATLDTIQRKDEYFQIEVNGNAIPVGAIVICTGQRVRQYETIQTIPGSEILKDSTQVFFNPSIIATQVAAFAGRQVAVVGGGDNALLSAAYIANTAQRVHLIVRSALCGFGLYQQAVMERIQSGQIILHRPAQIKRFVHRGDQIGITFQKSDGNLETLGLDAICFQLGYSPNTQEIGQLFQDGGIGTLVCTAIGHIQTDQFCRTSLPRVYAAGDVSNQRDPCVATAVGQGAITARSVEEDLRLLVWQSSIM